MDWPQYILALIAALGGGMTVREIVGAISRSKSGKMQSQRVQSKTLIARTRYAEELAEYERRFRIAVQDHASLCRRIAIEFGADPAELGPWPQPPEPVPVRPTDDTDTSTI